MQTLSADHTPGEVDLQFVWQSQAIASPARELPKTGGFKLINHFIYLFHLCLFFIKNILMLICTEREREKERENLRR